MDFKKQRLEELTNIASTVAIRMDLEWLGSTTNTADFQIRLTNTGTSTVKFNNLIVRGVHSPNITTGTISWKALNDNTIPAWLGWPQTGTTNLPYIAPQRKLNFPSATSIFKDKAAPFIPSGEGIIMGTFRVSTTTTWVPNSNFGFVWEKTSGGVVGYINNDTLSVSILHFGKTSTTTLGERLTVTAPSTQPLNK